MPDVTIKIEYTENFRQQVRDENDADPFGHLKITVDGAYLIGTDDAYVGVWLSEDLARLLATTEAMVTVSETVNYRLGPKVAKIAILTNGNYSLGCV